MEITNINELKKGENIIRKERNRENPYAQIYKGVINDRELSYKALGIATYVLSKPSDWEVYISDLTRDKVDGEKSVRSGLKELIKKGYMQRYPIYVNGLVYCWRTILNENPYKETEMIKNIKLTADESGNVVTEEIIYKNNENLLSQNRQVAENTDVELLSQNLQVDNLKGDNAGLLINDSTNIYLEEVVESSQEEVVNNNNDSTKEEIIELFAEVKPDKVTKYDKKALNELLNTYSLELIKKGIEVFGRFGGKSIEYLSTTLDNWKNKGLTTPEEIELHIQMLKEQSKKANENKKKKVKKIAESKVTASSGNKVYVDGVKQDSFNSYDQRDYTAEELEEIAKATRETEDVEEVKSTKEWLEKKRNKK